MTPFPLAAQAWRFGIQAAGTATAMPLSGKDHPSNEQKTIMAQIGDILEKERKRVALREVW